MMASTADDQSGHQSGGGGGVGGGGNPQSGGGGPPLFVMQSMQSPSERYLSNESLENDRNSTTSSTESPNSGGVIHRKVSATTYVSKHAFSPGVNILTNWVRNCAVEGPCLLLSP